MVVRERRRRWKVEGEKREGRRRTGLDQAMTRDCVVSLLLLASGRSDL